MDLELNLEEHLQSAANMNITVYFEGELSESQMIYSKSILNHSFKNIPFFSFSKVLFSKPAIMKFTLFVTFMASAACVRVQLHIISSVLSGENFSLDLFISIFFSHCFFILADDFSEGKWTELLVKSGWRFLWIFAFCCCWIFLEKLIICLRTIYINRNGWTHWKKCKKDVH